MLRYSLYFLLLLLGSACSDRKKNTEKDDESIVEQIQPKEDARIFNEDSAYQYVKAQVDFGPRVPGTAAHAKCFEYFVKVLTPLADTIYIQKTSAMTYDRKNIPVMNLIASFNPKAGKRVLLCAHWDTRPFADQDTVDTNKPIPGANDGASGVGVLLEVASALSKKSLDYGVDIIFFDAEDWGDNSGQVENSYCLGSQYWSQKTHIKNYRADFGILLDMVGAPNAKFGFEGFSLNHAQKYLTMVWEVAQNSGYGNYFINFQRGYVTDDHYYVTKHLGIPTLDIIDSDPNTETRFGRYWHTHSDNMDAIDKRTLKAVGQTVLNVLERY